MANLHQSFYRTYLSTLLITVLAGTALLLSGGCGTSAGALPSLVAADDTTEMNTYAVDLTDSKSGPSCAEIGPPKTTTQEEMFNALNEYRQANGLAPAVLLADAGEVGRRDG